MRYAGFNSIVLCACPATVHINDNVPERTSSPFSPARSPHSRHTSFNSSEMLPFPDEPLPHVQCSIADIIRHAVALLRDGETQLFCQLMLSGRLVLGDDFQHRVYVNARQGTQPTFGRDCTFTRDIDSVIGVTRDLPYRAPLAVFPMAPFKETLKRNNHVTAEITRPDVCPITRWL